MNLTPYIMFDGNCEEALNYYAEVLGGSISYMGKYGEAPMEVPEEHENLVMHATLQFEGGSLQASDSLQGVDYTTDAKPSDNIHMSLSVPGTLIDSVFEKLADGGEVSLPLDKQFWGDAFGMLRDKFGIQWMLSAERSDKAEETSEG